MKGIAAIVALTIVTTASSYALDETERREGAQNSSPAVEGGRHAITQTKKADHVVTRSARGGQSAWPSPLIALLEDEQVAAGQGQAGGAVACCCSNSYWYPRPSWTPIQGYGRFSGRYHSYFTYPVGDEIRLREAIRALYLGQATRGNR